MSADGHWQLYAARLPFPEDSHLASRVVTLSRNGKRLKSDDVAGIGSESGVLPPDVVLFAGEGLMRAWFIRTADDAIDAIASAVVLAAMLNRRAPDACPPAPSDCDGLPDGRPLDADDVRLA